MLAKLDLTLHQSVDDIARSVTPFMIRRCISKLFSLGLVKAGVPASILLTAGLSACQQSQAQGSLPLKSDTNGSIADLVLIYQGGVSRPSWTIEQLAPYVTWKPSETAAEKWLFDGFLFIEFRDFKGRDYAMGYKGKPGRKSEWRWLLERNFSKTNALGALDQAVGAAASRLGAPPVRRQVVLTLPEPIHGQTDWGTLDGRVLDFHRAEDRIAACKWHVEEAQAMWREANFKNIELAGFYWVAEQASKAQDILPHIGAAVRQKGFKFYWIPYWRANGAANWKQLGFDFAWQQPNHFFQPEVPDSRLEEAVKFAKTHGLGLEFEADNRAITSKEKYRPRFYSYLNAFDRFGAATNASVAYYEGGGVLLEMANSEEPSVRELYDDLCKWVVRRQESLHKPPSKE